MVTSAADKLIKGGEVLRADLQADAGVLHTLLRQAGDGERLTVVFKTDLPRCFGLGPADVVIRIG